VDAVLLETVAGSTAGRERIIRLRSGDAREHVGLARARVDLTQAYIAHARAVPSRAEVDAGSEDGRVNLEEVGSATAPNLEQVRAARRLCEGTETKPTALAGTA
jgi:hypothetical protein